MNEPARIVFADLYISVRVISFPSTEEIYKIDVTASGWGRKRAIQRQWFRVKKENLVHGSRLWDISAEEGRGALPRPTHTRGTGFQNVPGHTAFTKGR